MYIIHSQLYFDKPNKSDNFWIYVEFYDLRFSL